jgi:hypothetical protein
MKRVAVKGEQVYGVGVGIGRSGAKNAAEDPVVVMAAGLAALEAEDRCGWSGPALADRVATLACVSERTEVELVRLVAQLDAEGSWLADGSLSPVRWLTRNTPLSASSAARMVRVARLARVFDEMGNALWGGVLTVAQLDAWARQVTPERAGVFGQIAGIAVDESVRVGSRQTAALARGWAAIADDLIDADPGTPSDRRELQASLVEKGRVKINGLLDPDNGAVVLAALQALDRPDPVGAPEGERTHAQRMADNLGEMARRSLALNDQGQPHTDPAHAVHVIIDEDTLHGHGHGHGDENEGDQPGDRDDAACEHDVEDHERPSCARATATGQGFGGRVSAVVGLGAVAPATVRQWVCTSWLSRVVRSADGEVLDIGRKVRLFTPAQRRAIIVRDLHCVFPGCDRGPSWCDVHHLHPFAHGGSSDVANGALLCRRHHRLVHHDGWELARGPDGTWTAVRARWHTVRPETDHPQPVHPDAVAF